ncbi:MAG TPA: putative quinol monooxygenase [Polyangiaceae bacterium]|nr:putative quinol monooxygenase [Polyangiaceae bacterium]
MYGLVGKFIAHAGKREALISVLAAASHELPGCLSYVVARDASDADTLWVTEVWDDAASHAASLKLPAVQQAIQQARPWIRNIERVATTEPVGGLGLRVP